MNETDDEFLDTEERKRKLVERFGGSPFLVFIFDHWFGVFALVFLFGVIALSLFLPRIWRQTPDGFNPVIRVSGLDLWQARSLRKTALKQAAAGRTEESVHAWRSAIANSTADVSLLREGLQYVASLPNPPDEQIEFAINHSFWLLRLGNTNAADAELSLRLLTKYGMDDQVVRLGSRLEDFLTPDSSKLLLTAFFNEGKVTEFDRLWRRFSTRFESDPEMMLYRQAWMANWGPPATLQQGRNALVEARSNPKHRILALRLQVLVSYAMRDESTFAQVLRLLEEERETRLSDHAMHWMLMNALGRRDQARELAQNHQASPRSPAEVRVMVVALNQLGLNEVAISFGEQQLKKFSFDAELWLLQAEGLTRLKKWDDLRTLAVGIRNELSLQGLLDGYSHYLEALAEVNLDRPEAARAAADRLVRSVAMAPDLSRYVSREMQRIGFPEVAHVLLRPLEVHYAKDATYWFERTSAALLSNNPEDLVLSAERAYALDPADASIVNNYAASLIVTRTKPAEAVQLTLKVMVSRPGDLGSELNHILALLMVGRHSEVEAGLRRINTLALTPSESAVYHLAWFEYYLERKDWVAARIAYGKIDPRKLVALQVSWMDEKFKAIPPG
jgi:tetratricopeptide (TPR) repeat protein